jgi:hypothetical protein
MVIDFVEVVEASQSFIIQLGETESHWAFSYMNSYVKGYRRTPAWLSQVKVLHLAPFSPAIIIWRSDEQYDMAGR